MNLDTKALMEACLKVAKNALWDTKPYDADKITTLAEEYYKIAYNHVEFLTEHYDPNVLIRAINYIAVITIPCGGSTEWFDSYLQALIELACPNLLSEEKLEFLQDVEDGIAVIRSEVGGD